MRPRTRPTADPTKAVGREITNATLRETLQSEVGALLQKLIATVMKNSSRQTPPRCAEPLSRGAIRLFRLLLPGIPFRAASSSFRAGGSLFSPALEFIFRLISDRRLVCLLLIFLVEPSVFGSSASPTAGPSEGEGCPSLCQQRPNLVLPPPIKAVGVTQVRKAVSGAYQPLRRSGRNEDSNVGIVS